MELKDFKIGADELIEFMNSKVCYEETSTNNNGLHVHFFYKIKMSDFVNFITSKSIEDVKTETVFRISGNDLVGVLSKLPKKSEVPKIPGTRHKVGTKDEYTVYDGDEKKYYKKESEV